MISQTNVSALVFALLVALAFPMPLPAQEGTGSHRAEAIRRYEELLRNPSPALAGRKDELSFRLGLLYLESAQAAPPSSGGYGNRPLYDKAISLFNQVLEGRDTMFREDSLYYRAVAFEEIGRREEAMTSFRNLAREHPSSSHAPEVWFRLGNDAVQKNRLAEAQQAYDEVLRRSDPRYRDQATYMFAWSSFSLQQDSRARTALVDLLTRLEAAGQEGEDLHKQSVELLAKVVRSEGNTAALSGPWVGERPAFAKAALRRTADLYRETSAFENAARTYEQLLREYPDLDDAPAVEKLVIECYLKAENLDAADVARSRLIERYGSGGLLGPEHAAELAPLLKDSALYRHKLARDTKRPEVYAQAVKAYEAYIGNTPDGPVRAEAIFFQADALKEAGDLGAAAERYKAIADSRDPKHGEGAAFSRVAILEELKTRGQVAVEPVLGAYEEYFQGYPAGAHEAELRSRYAGYLFEEKRYADALTAGSIAVTRMADSPEKQRLQLLLTRAAFAAEDYPQSSSWANQLLASKTLPPETRAAAEDIHATAIYKLAESLKDRPLESASHYELLNRLYPKHKTAPAALYNAAILLRDNNEKTRSLGLFRKLIDTYPGSELARDSMAAAATLHQEFGDRNGAAELLELAADRAGAGSPEGADLLYQAAVQARDAGSHQRAAELFKKYLARQPASDLRGVSARAGIAKAMMVLGREADAERAAQEAASRAPFGLSGDDQQRAQAMLAEARSILGELALKRFDRVRLVEPLASSLKKKQQALDETVMHFQQAAAYGFADVALASYYKIGYAQLGFAKALMQAPRPRNLNAEERSRYDSLLVEQTRPYREGAEKAFRVTLEQAQAAGVENEWTARARGALAEFGGVGQPVAPTAGG